MNKYGKQVHYCRHVHQSMHLHACKRWVMCSEPSLWYGDMVRRDADGMPG